MAKKKQKFELDEYGFDSSLDVPDFTASVPPIKDDRKPVTQVKDAVFKGMKDTAKSPAFIESVIKKSLPKGYGEAKDLADNAVGTVKELYDTAAHELKPAIRDARKLTKRLLPGIEDKLPKNIAKKVRDWANVDDEEVSLQANIAQQREGQIAATMGQIFSMEQQQAAQQQKEGEVKDQLDETLRQKRHLDQMGQLDAMRVSMAQLANYHDRVDSAWKRKSLELQYRHYFVAVDTLEEARRAGVIAKQNLEIIAKNTGLPEFVKLKMSERFWEMSRNKLMENMFGARTGFLGKVRESLVRKVKSQAQGLSDGIRMGVGAAQFGIDAHEAENQMAEAFGEATKTGAEKAGEMAGGTIMGWAGNKIGKLARKHVFDKSDKLTKGGNVLMHGVENAPQMLREFANGDKWDGLPGMRFLKDAIRESTATDTRVLGDKAGSMTQPDMFSRMTNKSITEVIPGYLSRILKELTWTRTKEEPDLVVYDYNANKFNDRKSAMANVFNSIIKKGDKSGVKFDLDNFWKEFDPNGDKLTPEQRKAVGAMLVKDNLNNRDPSLGRYTKAENFSGEARAHSAELAAFFKNIQDNDPRGERYYKFGHHMSRLGSSITDARGAIQTQSNIGNREELERLGIMLPGSDFINMEKLYDYSLGDVTGLQPKPVESPTDRRGEPTPRGREFLHTAAQQFQQGMGPRQQQQQPQPAAPTHLASENIRGTAAGNYKDECTCTEEIIKALRENSASDGIKQANETLLRIEKQLAAGIPLVDGKGNNIAELLQNGFKGLGDHLSEMKTGIKGLADRTMVLGKDFVAQSKRWWNRTLGDNLMSLGGSAIDAVKGGFKMAGKAIKTASKTSMWGLGKLKNLAKTGFEQGGNLLSKAKEHMDRVKPVYVPGISEPVLNVAKFKEGHYRDKVSGKVITRFEDIVGAVIDAETGQEVLTSEQAKEAYVKGVRANSKRSIVKGFKMGRDGFNKVLSWLPPTYRFAVKAIDKTIDFFFNRPQDVYVKGEMDKPKLLGSIMKNGGYFSRLTTKVIEHPGQIDGPVVDDKGQTVLSQEDIAKGLVDVKGRPIKTGWKKVFQYGKDMLDTGKKIGKKVLERSLAMSRHVLKGMKAVGGTVWGGLKRAFKLDGYDQSADTVLQGEVLKVQAEQLDRLTQIYKLLKDRLPNSKKVFGDEDGDGDRDGSYKDLLQKAKDKLKGKGAGEAGEAGAGKGAGGVGAAVAGALNKLKKSVDEKSSGISPLEVAEAGGLLTAAKLWGKRILKGAGNLASKGAGALWSLGKGAVGLVGRGATAAGTAAGDNVAGKVLRGTGSLLGGARGLMEKAPGVLKGVWKGAGGLVRGVPGMVVKGAKAAVPIIAEATPGIVQGLKSGAGSLWRGAKDLFKGGVKDAAKSVVGAGGQMVEHGTKFVRDHSPEILDKAGNVIRRAGEAAPTRLSQAKDVLKGGFSKAADFAKGGLGRVKDLFKGASAEGATTAAKDLAVSAGKGMLALPGKAFNVMNLGLPNAAKGAVTGAGTMLKEGAANALKYGKNLIKLPALLEAAAGGALGYGADWALGKAGVGKNVDVNEKLDDANWKNMNWMQKVESGVGRTMEKAGEMFFLDNLAKEAAAKRIANETKYLQNKAKIDIQGPGGAVKTREAIKYLEETEAAQKKAEAAKLEKAKKAEEAKPKVPGTTTPPTTLVPPQPAKPQEPVDPVVGFAPEKKPEAPAPGTTAVPPASLTQVKAATDAAAEPTPVPVRQLKEVLGTGYKDKFGKDELDGAGMPKDPVTFNGPTVATPGAQLPQLAMKSATALTAIRYKAYGLVEMDSDKVQALQALEAYIAKDLTLKDDGRTLWKGDINDLLKTNYRFFGDAISEGAETKFGFMLWLKNRFFPVFMSYLMAVKQQTGSSDLDKGPQSLTNQQALDVAKVIVGTQRPNGSEVWTFTAKSPWPNYALNGDKTSIQGNMRALEKAVKEKPNGAVVADPTAKTGANSPDSKPKEGSLGDGGSEASKEAMGEKPSQEPQGFLASIKDKLSSAWNTTKEHVKSAYDALTSGAGVKNAASALFGGAGGSTTATGKEDTSAGYGGGAGAGLTAGAGGAVDSLPVPKGEGKWEYFQELFGAVGKMVGIDPGLMGAMSAQESGFRPAVKAPGSTATGLFQFIRGTWNAMLKKYGPKYGIPPGTPPTDPRANAILGACYIRENLEGLKQVVQGRELTATDAYMAHFLGLGGARSFLRNDPKTIGAQAMPDAARANPTIFWKDPGRQQPRTFGEIYQVMRGFLAKKAKQYGVPYTDGGGPPVVTPGQDPAPADGAKSTDAAGSKPTTAPGTSEAGAGRGSVNPPMASPAPSIPVSSQQAGVTSPAPAPVSDAGAGRGSVNPPAANPSTAAAPAPAADAAVSAMGSGFQPQQARDVQAQRQYQKETSADAFGPVNDILKETLGVNKSQLEVLGAIRDILMRNPGAVVTQPKEKATAEGSANSPSSSTAAVRKPAQQTPRAPVSMAKSIEY